MVTTAKYAGSSRMDFLQRYASDEMYSTTVPLSTSPLQIISTHPARHQIAYCCPCPAPSLIALAFAVAKFLFSPCLPFYPPTIHQAPDSTTRSFVLGIENTLTCHLANRRSISPLRSACSLGCSFKDRRTIRAATARYRLYLRSISRALKSGQDRPT